MESTPISLKDLRENLKEGSLRKSGALNSVKASIRKEFIQTLSHKKSNEQRVLVDNSLRTRILMSLIYHHLKLNGMTHTLSVFLAECGYESSGFLSEDDLLEAFKLTRTTSSLFSSSSKHYHQPAPQYSTFDILVETYANTNKHCIDASIQTDLAGPGIREVLDSQIKELHLNYLTRRETDRALPNKTIEERMIAYQRECEERLKREYECQLNHIRNVEISAIKHDEGMKMRLQVEQLRAELEYSYQQRLSIYDEKETQQKQALLDSERRIQQLEYESRQRIQRELDEIRGREEATRRKNEMEVQTTKLLETRLKEMQAVIESREREIGRREKEFEIRQSEIHAVAHEEARLSVETQLESILREKAALMIERKRFEDEKANDTSLRLAISEMRAKHREMETDIANKDDEINTLKTTLIRLQNSLVAEDKDVSKLLDSCGWTNPKQFSQQVNQGDNNQDLPLLSSLGGIGGGVGKMDGIIIMIRRNIQLEANVTQLQRELTSEAEITMREKKRSEDLMISLENYRKELEETKASKNELGLQYSRMQTDMGKLKKHILKLRQALEESNKEKEELTQLITEQRSIIEKLRGKLANKPQHTFELSPSQYPPERHPYVGSIDMLPSGWISRPINYYGQIQPGLDQQPTHSSYPNYQPVAIPPSSTAGKSPDQIKQTLSPPLPPPSSSFLSSSLPQNRVQQQQQQQQQWQQPQQQQQHPSAHQVNEIQYHSQTAETVATQSFTKQDNFNHFSTNQVIATPSTILAEEEEDNFSIPKIELNEREIEKMREKELEKEKQKEQERELERERERLREIEREEREEFERKQRDEQNRREREARERKEREDRERKEKEDREWRERREIEDRERKEKEEINRRERERLETERKMKEERDREEQRLKEERESRERREREEREKKEREDRERREEEERVRREEKERELEEERQRIEKEKEEKYRLENAEMFEEERKKQEAEEKKRKQKEEDEKILQEARAKVKARKELEQKNRQAALSSSSSSSSTSSYSAVAAKPSEPSRLPPSQRGNNESVQKSLSQKKLYDRQSSDEEDEDEVVEGRSVGEDESSDFSWG